MSVMIGLSATKNFHTYDYNNLGQANISYVFQPSVGLDIALTKNIKFNLNGDWTRAQTYQEVEKSQFSIAESIEYEEPSWRIAIGHSNSGDVHQYNGREYTVKAFDENTSVIFTSLAATF